MKKKKSDSSNSLQESEGSDSGLKGVIKKVGDLRGKPDQMGDRVYSIEGIAPTLASQRGNSSRGSLLVSGVMKSTNTVAKSIEKDSEAKNSLKAISGKSPSQTYPTMTFSAVGSLVKVFPLREGVKVFKTSQGELYSLKSAESLEVKDQTTYSLRMLKDYFLTTQAEPSQLYCFRWMNLGTMSNGRCVTLNISFHKTGKGSLSSVLEDEVDEKYYLTNKSWERFLKRDMGKITDGENEKAGCLSLKNQSGQAQWDGGTTLISDSGLHRKSQIRKNMIPPLRANTGASSNNLLYSGRIRRLTPVECERLQGFPDNWTRVPTRNNNAGMAWDCHPESKETIIKGKIMSDTQRYKMMGNAVSVPVITAIGKKILKSVKQNLA